jgi:thioesterase domain-containing protein
VEALAHLMEEGGDGHRWTSLVPIQPTGTRPPIYCVHGGAGTVLHLEPLARALGEDQPFYGLQARGLYGRAAPLKTVEEMAAHYLSEVRTLQPEGPYYLSGYCFGTVVAFDMAMQLVDAGEEVALLAMLTGPSATWTRQWRWHGNQPSIRHRYEYMIAQARAQAQPQTRRARLAAALRHPSRLPRPAVRAARKAALRLALVTGRPVPEEARDAFFLQLHSRAERSYYERGVYPGDMLVICGEGMYEDPDAGWGSFVAGEIESHVVPGHHTRNRQLMMEPYVLEVRDHIQQYLARESEIAP